MGELAVGDDALWYDTRGDGRPLVFVHGGWMDGDAWTPQIDRFEDEYRTITLDVRGHGRTGETDPRRYSIDLFADDLETLLSHLEVERPILCGLSLGSMIVQEYLARHPDRAAGAILAGAVRSMPPVDLPPGAKPLLSPMPAMAATVPAMGSRTAFRSLLCSIRATTGSRWLSVDPDVRDAAMASVDRVSAAEFLKIFGALYRFDPPDLSLVETPTVVVHGEHEAPPVRRQGRELASAVDDGRYRTITDAGHLVNQDRPAAFNDATATFLEAAGA